MAADKRELVKRELCAKLTVRGAAAAGIRTCSGKGAAADTCWRNAEPPTARSLVFTGTSAPAPSTIPASLSELIQQTNGRNGSWASSEPET